MVSKATIDNFLQQNHIAVAGVSRNAKKFGAIVYRHLKDNGYNVHAINPNVAEINGEVVYPGVAALPDEVSAIITVTKPDVTQKIVEDAAARGIKMIWMQQGSESREAIRLAEEKGLTAVSGKCIMMFAEPVKSIHSFHRFLMKLFGRYPA